MVNLESFDDAAVYRLTNDLSLVVTLDFFTPIVDDPYWFGAIAAANALSDIYAMGGVPLFALNILGFPIKMLGIEVMTEILRGGQEKAAEAGIPIMGGHSIDDREPKYGMCVIGRVEPENLVTNANAKIGDHLILTKPIGTGIVTTGIKKGIVEEEVAASVVRLMAALNRPAAEIMRSHQVRCATDITGFGLLGHAGEIASASGVCLEIRAHSVPLISGTRELAERGAVPGGSLSNQKYIQTRLTRGVGISELTELILCDAQTSGGILMAVKKNAVESVLHSLHRQGIESAAEIGCVVEGAAGTILLSS